ncbi:hypothetical protein LCGC14_2243850 [marine sediment metagenome]|uniref:Uncharacterized protein n=1 Tax=marine sediment metagenome TaxID=412755 RepID=A0A0F9D4T7_9ZZZZ
MAFNIKMRRVSEGMKNLKLPGDFFWTYEKDDEWDGKQERTPVRLWYYNPYARIGSITISPNVQENGASWKWDGNLDEPTIHPSINEHSSNSIHKPSPDDWHGWIHAGIMS